MSDHVDVRDLKVLRLLLEVGSLTRAAQIMGCGQSGISKALARLRRYFEDPLLVRAGRSMRPTPKALALVDPLADLLAASEKLRTFTPHFEPETSAREFVILVTEVGTVQIVPRLVQHIQTAGPDLRLRALTLDTRSFAARLEAGEADLAVGAFPDASGALRRQHLYIDGYTGVARHDHPRIERLKHDEGFSDEQHVTVAARGDGYSPHERLEQALLTSVPLSHVRMRVPSFLAAAVIASRTDMVTVLPANLADLVCDDLGLTRFNPPLRLRPIRIDQLWHEHSQQDRGHRWLRETSFGLFASSGGHGLDR